MSKPAGLGIWCATNVLSRNALLELAKKIERHGYDTLWYPESLSYECFALGSFLLSNTSKLKLGSGIANIYARDPITSAQGHDSLNNLFGSRFILGLGVSHVPLVEGVRGHQYGKPIGTMRAYLEKMAAANIDPTIQIKDRSIVLAALGPKMLALSRDAAKGSLPYCVTPEHTAQAREIQGPNSWLCVEQKICLTSDKSAARSVARQQMARYMTLDNYRKNWFRLGFSENEVSGEGDPKFLDAMVVWGGEKQIRDCIEAHFRAGADQVAIQPFKPNGEIGSDLKALEVFAPGGN